MKKVAFAGTLIMVSIIFSVLAPGPSAVTCAEPSAGVKKGDWIEYCMSITGPPLDDPLRNITWYRTEILGVDGASFRANKTGLTVNGTFFSSIWDFNLTEGQVRGWAIIPANLGRGDTFFDVAKSANITIEGEEQRTLLGASRTVTHASDPGKVYKEWDRATGVYVHAVEHTTDYTVVTNAVATNMWSPKALDGNQSMFYGILAAGVVLAVLAVSRVIVVRRKRVKQLVLRYPSQGKIAALTILTVVIGEVAFILFFPFYQVGLSFAEINLIMQTLWTAMVYVSLWFRMKGNYFVHELTMLVVITAWLVGLSAVLLMDPLSSSSSQILANTPLRLVMNSLHGIFSVPALVFGLWLVVLWRPESSAFADKSRRIAQVIALFWIPSYVVGVLDFMVLHTALLG